MRTNTETYTGLPPNYQLSPSSVASSFKVKNPPMLPPLVSIAKISKVTMDTSARLPSSWRSAIGKTLTNRRIAEYQREGMYGSGLKLPPLNQALPCCECKSHINTRKCPFDYLPKPGVYCKKCLTKHRAERDKQLEENKRAKEAFMNEYI